jgi:hypothetical protein
MSVNQCIFITQKYKFNPESLFTTRALGQEDKCATLTLGRSPSPISSLGASTLVCKPFEYLLSNITFCVLYFTILLSSQYYQYLFVSLDQGWPTLLGQGQNCLEKYFREHFLPHEANISK